MRRRLVPLLVAAVLAGCGGGFYIGIGDEGDGPPSVSLAAPVSSVAAGATVRVVAAAADADGIDELALYRIDGDAAVFVASDTVAPYEWDVLVPADGRSTLRLFARATDGWGDRADSRELVLTVTP